MRSHSFVEVISPPPQDVFPIVLQEPLFVLLGKVLGSHSAKLGLEQTKSTVCWSSARPLEAAKSQTRRNSALVAIPFHSTGVASQQTWSVEVRSVKKAGANSTSFGQRLNIGLRRTPSAKPRLCP